MAWNQGQVTAERLAEMTPGRQAKATKETADEEGRNSGFREKRLVGSIAEHS